MRSHDDNLPVIVVTRSKSLDDAILAMKAGAYDYLIKPFDMDELLLVVDRYLKARHSENLVEKLQSDYEDIAVGDFVGRSVAVQQLFTLVDKVAKRDSTVLLLGESGTGKEMIACAIHEQSSRNKRPLIRVNCAAIPRDLFESEFFGHVKGAFTGAFKDRTGRFELADGGTIFLDEVGEIPLELQSKLLRVLQDGEVFMVGSTRPREMDVRVLAATNKDLQTLIAKGLFREDLFFRLNVISIVAPPLRERLEDIVQLSRYFIGKFASEYDLPAPHLNGRVEEALLQYPWPGNVRELENLMQRLVVMSPGEAIKMPHLPRHMRFTVASERGLDRTLAEVEREHIRIPDSGGNRSPTPGADAIRN